MRNTQEVDAAIKISWAGVTCCKLNLNAVATVDQQSTASKANMVACFCEVTLLCLVDVRAHA